MRRIIVLFVSTLFIMSCVDSGIKVTAFQPVIPVLVGKDINPVLMVEVIRNEPVDYLLKEISLDLGGTTNISDIKSIHLVRGDDEGKNLSELQFGEVQLPTSTVTFKDELKITEDTFKFWVAVKLKEEVNLEHKVRIECKNIITDNKKNKIHSENISALRVGVAVRQHMQDGIHTSRIPGLTTTKKGTLLAIYDARYESARDLQGHMDIGLNRSFDGGRTWEPIQIVMDMQEWGGLPENYNGVSDACILVDEYTGDIYVAGLWMHGVLDKDSGRWVEGLTRDSTRWIHQWHAKGSQSGYGVKETSQFLIVKSSDDGLSWSEPINITNIKKEDWWLFAPAPGHGITLSDGTLVFPTQGRDELGMPFSNITWSKDHGKTWTTSNPAHKNTTECMAAELSNGAVMLNMRDNRNRGIAENNGRTIFTTDDLGDTWIEHPTSRSALIEPTCMASLHQHYYMEDDEKRSVLLFVNPASISKRNNITLKVSYDEGNTWPIEKQVLLDEFSGRGYSCITSVNDSTIGILYESSQADMVFQTVLINEIR